MSSTNKNKPSRRSAAKDAQKALAGARTSGSGHNLRFAGGAILVLVVLITIVAIAVGRSANNPPASSAAAGTSSPPSTAPGGNGAPPWPAPSDAGAAVRSAGLPMLSAEGTVEHIHAHLDVVVDGQPVAVPAYLGIDQVQAGISPLHTHDDSGVIHIESPAKTTFTLGQFFHEWGVPLSADTIGGLHATNDRPLRVFVNGSPRTGDPAALPINAHDEIVLVYGPPQPSEQIPNNYAFPTGE